MFFDEPLNYRLFQYEIAHCWPCTSLPVGRNTFNDKALIRCLSKLFLKSHDYLFKRETLHSLCGLFLCALCGWSFKTPPWFLFTATSDGHSKRFSVPVFTAPSTLRWMTENTQRIHAKTQLIQR